MHQVRSTQSIPTPQLKVKSTTIESTEYPQSQLYQLIPKSHQNSGTSSSDMKPRIVYI